jgi:serine protease Do
MTINQAKMNQVKLLSPSAPAQTYIPRVFVTIPSVTIPIVFATGRTLLLAVALLSFETFARSSTGNFLMQAAYAEGKTPIEEAQGLSEAFQGAAKNITASVVNISSFKKASLSKSEKKRLEDPFFDPFREFFGEDFIDKFGKGGRPQQGLGTGVILDKEGHIVTNNHVVGEADEVMVRLSGEKTPITAKIVGLDPRSDIAIIKIPASSSLQPAVMGNSDDLKIGEWVIAAGNPFGLDNSITAGIVSAKGRSLEQQGQFEDFIQTDAAINPGNSGGPLVNLQGEVIGINTAIFSRSGGYMGIGFAIPSNMTKMVAQSLIKDGRVIRGWLGVGIQDLSRELAESFGYQGTTGALVAQVQPDSPADKGGLKQGDIITHLNGIKMEDVNHLRNLIAATLPNSKVKVTTLRDGRENEITLEIGELLNEEVVKTMASKPTFDIGLSIENITPDIARKLESKQTSGVLVTNVEAGSIAAQAGILIRDIIIKVNEEQVKDVDQVIELLSKERLKKGVRILVESNRMERFVFLKTEGNE